MPNSQPQTCRCKSAVAACLLFLLAGCTPSERAGDDARADLRLEGVKLKLLIVGDPALAEAARRVRGEWNTLTGSDFTLQTLSEEGLADGAVAAADAIICPSYQLGPLAERKLITPVPKQLLPGGVLREAASDWDGIFELLVTREAAWGSDVLAVPLGSPVLTVYYRADLLEKLNRRPPQTWAEYRELAELLDDRFSGGDAAGQTEPWCGTIEPLAPGWAALVLLARAAPYAKHPDNYSTLFEINTMEPLVAGPPFVRALEELAAAAKAGPADPLGFDPVEARAAFWRGECGMALSWPTAAAKVPARTPGRVGLAELPGSEEVYAPGTSLPARRAQRDDPQVPLLAIAGRIGVVSRESKRTEAAFRLLFWLSGRELSPQVCGASPATTLFRQGHLESPQMWVEEPASRESAAEYGAIARRTFVRQQCLMALRIPGRSEYLAALDEAVRQAVAGQRSPAESLRRVATAWDEVTGRLGRDRQKAAYRHSLGLD